MKTNSAGSCDGDGASSKRKGVLFAMRQGDEFSDARMICEGQSYPVHRSVLAWHSAVFRNAFSGNFSESMSKTVHVSGVSAEICEIVLDFMYEIPIEGQLRSWNVIKQVWQTAHMYDIGRLVELTEEAAMHVIDTTNALDVLQTAELLTSRAVLGCAIVFISQSLTLIAKQTKFTTLDSRVLSAVLLSAHKVPEIEKYRALITWIDFDKNARTSLGKMCIAAIHFERASGEHLSEMLKREELVDRETLIEIFAARERRAKLLDLEGNGAKGNTISFPVEMSRKRFERKTIDRLYTFQYNCLTVDFYFATQPHRDPEDIYCGITISSTELKKLDNHQINLGCNVLCDIGSSPWRRKPKMLCTLRGKLSEYKVSRKYTNESIQRFAMRACAITENERVRWARKAVSGRMKFNIFVELYLTESFENAQVAQVKQMRPRALGNVYSSSEWSSSSSSACCSDSSWFL